MNRGRVCVRVCEFFSLIATFIRLDDIQHVSREQITVLKLN